MPELPEVETVKRGLMPHIAGQIIHSTTVRQPKLRWPVDKNLPRLIKNQRILSIERRGKYLIIGLASSYALIIHLGMSGQLRLVPANQPVGKHDHVDLSLSNDLILRYTDPRRFGCILISDQPYEHVLLSSLGIEPLTRGFTAQYLFNRMQRKHIPIKSLIMDSKIVVGVGNIYANEALFNSKIHPLRPSASLLLTECQTLVNEIKSVLKAAIKQGGTTLKDFISAEGKPGYFSQQLNVYGRHGQACYECGADLKEIRINNRSTVYCPSCQLS